MALKVVNFKIQDYGGSPRTRTVWITPSQVSVLAGSPGLELPASPIPVTIAANGTASVSLQANDDLSPAGGYYTLNVPTGDAVDAAINFVVPQSAGPFDLSQIVVASPAPSPPTALDSAVVHLANPETIIGHKAFRSGRPWIDLTADAKCDGNFVSDAVCTAGSPFIDSASGLFTPADTGKLFDLYSGGIVGTQVGSLTYVSATRLQMSVNANHNAAAAAFVWGTDDTVAVQTWLNRTGGTHRFAGGVCFVTGTVTSPAGMRMEGSSGFFWVSQRLGAAHFLNMDACLAGSYIKGISFNASLGFTGRFITWSTNNEAGSNSWLEDIHTFNPTDDGDYHIFLYNNACRLLNIAINANNKLYNKAIAISCSISQAAAIGCNLIGRCYSNCQEMSYIDCTTGPLRVANNSVNDGSGTSQQTNVVTVDHCYVYSSNRGGADMPCIQSVATSATGADVAGGVMPNINSGGTYYIFGSGLNVAQSAVSGNFAASQGATGAVFDACTFTQSGSSPATDVTVVTSTGGSPPIYLTACTGNILSAVTTAKIFVAASGLGECIVSDYMPSGQAVPWQHPSVATTVGVLSALPASGTSTTRNTFAIAFDMWVNLNGAVLTKVEISKDGAAWVNLFNDGANAASRALLIFRWPPGTWIRFTYTTATPNYILVPAP